MDCEPLTEVILNNIMQENFSLKTTEDMIFVTAGDFRYQYPRPDGITAKRVVAAFEPANNDVPDMQILKSDIASYDG